MRREPCGAVPFSWRSPVLDRVPVQTILLHSLDQARRAVVPDAQLALEVGGRGFLAFGDDLDRLAIQLRLGIVFAGRLAVEQVATVLGLLGDRLDIVGRALLAPMFG